MLITLKKLKGFSPVFTVILLGIIFYQININKLIGTISQSNVIYILATGLILSPILLFLLAFRLKVILDHIGISIAFKEVLYFNSYGLLWGELSPGKIGELLRARFIIPHSKGRIELSIYSVIIDRLYDLVVLFLFLIMSCCVLANQIDISFKSGTVITTVIGITSFLAIYCFRVMIYSSSKKIIELFLGKYKANFSFHYSDFFSRFNQISITNHIQYLAVSILIWVTKLLSLPLFAKAIGVELSFVFILAVGTLSIGIALLPLSISGIGTREAVFIYFLSLHDIDPESALTISVLFYTFGLWSIFIAFIMAYTGPFRHKVKVSK